MISLHTTRVPHHLNTKQLLGYFAHLIPIISSVRDTVVSSLSLQNLAYFTLSSVLNSESLYFGCSHIFNFGLFIMFAVFACPFGLVH